MQPLSTCDSSNLFYVVICPTCDERYTSYTGIDKTKLRDHLRFFRKHIRHPQNQNLKVEEHLRTCGKGTFKNCHLLYAKKNQLDFQTKQGRWLSKPKGNKK